MATLTKKHMLFGAELVARMYREARLQATHGEKLRAWVEMKNADAVRGKLSQLFASFNDAYNRERFFDACEDLSPDERAVIEDGSPEHG